MMNRWLRRLVYLLLVIVWLMVMSFPTVAFFLATQGEIRLGKEDGSHLRLHLIQEEESQGVSLEWTRRAGQALECRQSHVYYFLWQGTGENVSFCQCYDPVSSDLLSVESGSCTER